MKLCMSLVGKANLELQIEISFIPPPACNYEVLGLLFLSTIMQDSVAKGVGSIKWDEPCAKKMSVRLAT